MKLRTLVVDDEAAARRGVCRMLERCGGVEVVGECASGREAIAAIREHAPDVVFLDVQMPGQDGFDVMATLGGAHTPAVVFLTAHADHAIRAFDVDALDYLLKPVDPERLERSLERVRRHVAQRGPERGERLERVVVKRSGHIYFVDVRDVSHFESVQNYVRVHTLEDVHLIRSTLTSLEERLDPQRFVRIRRSTIVSVEHIDHLEPLLHGQYAIVLRDGAQLTSSRRYRRALDALLG